MDRFFGHNKKLVEGLKVLMVLLKYHNSINDFYSMNALSGYNLEKLTNRDEYSIRIIPKKRKSQERMLIIKIDKSGTEIKILEINKHYK